MPHYPSAIYSPRFRVPAYPPKHLREHPRVPNFASPKARMRLPEPIKITIPVKKGRKNDGNVLTPGAHIESLQEHSRMGARHVVGIV